VALRTGIATVLACTALVAGAGCGGDEKSDDGASGASPLTAAEYRKQGNALCKEAVREVGAIPEPNAPDEIAGYLEEVFDASEQVNDEFVKLQPPEELRADHERAVELGEESQKTFDGVIERVRAASDPQAALREEFRELVPELERAQKLNTRLGLEECNEIGPPSEQPAPS
jgi:hypothetical protein